VERWSNILTDFAATTSRRNLKHLPSAMAIKRKLNMPKVDNSKRQRKPSAKVAEALAEKPKTPAKKAPAEAKTPAAKTPAAKTPAVKPPAKKPVPVKSTPKAAPAKPVAKKSAPPPPKKSEKTATESKTEPPKTSEPPAEPVNTSPAKPVAKKKGFSKEVKASVLNKVFSPGKVEKKKSDKKAGGKPTSNIAAALRAFATAAMALAEALEEQPLVNASTVPVPAPQEQKGKKKKTKDPNAPKRALTAFMCFAKDKRGELLKANPKMKVPEMGKELGAAWAKCADKSKYQALAVKDKERYEAEMTKYKTASREE